MARDHFVLTIRVPKPGLRWLQFSLATGFLAFTALCVWLAWRTQPSRARWEFAESNLLIPFDPRPTDIKLTEWIEAIESEIAWLRKIGYGYEADAMEEELAQRRNLEGPYGVPGDQLHVVGFYHGVRRPRVEGKSPFNRFGDAKVRVTYDGAPIVLVLCAYESIEWSVEVAPGVQIERVILGGYRQQQIVGLSEGIPVAGATSEASEQPVHHSFYAWDPESRQRIAPKLKQLTGRRITTFQGAYDPGKGSTWIVGKESSSWRQGMILNALRPLWRRATARRREQLARELGRVRFWGLNQTGADEGDRPVLAEFTIFGPSVPSMLALEERAQCLAVDPSGPKFFAMAEGPSLTFVDASNGAMEPITDEAIASFLQTKSPAPTGPPRGFRPAGRNSSQQPSLLAYDTKRDRLLIWGPNSLGAYDVETKQLSTLRHDRPELTALAYAPDEDLLYGLMGSHREQFVSKIRAFNARGADLRTIPIVPRISVASDREMSFVRQLFSVGDKLVLFTPAPHFAEPDTMSMQAHVIDPATGKLLLTPRLEPRTPPSGDDDPFPWSGE